MTQHAIDRDEVMAYVDGELAGVRLAEVEAHVATCDECGTLIHEIREVSVRLSGWQVADAPNGLVGVKQALSAAAISKAPAPAWWRRRGFLNIPRWVTVGGLAAVAGVLLIAPWMTSLRRAPLEPAMPAARNAAALETTQQALDNRHRATIAAQAESSRPALPGQGQGGGDRVQLMQRGADARPSEARERASQARDRMIVRAATMVLTSDRFDQIRAEIERLVAAQQGRVTSLNMSGDPSSRRSLRATVGVPAARLDALLTGLRGLGRVQEESLGSDDVTESFRDLTLRTANARREEQRLVELLTRRTGDLADVLAVEREVARVRLDIERMEAETRATEHRVDLATRDADGTGAISRRPRHRAAAAQPALQERAHRRVPSSRGEPRGRGADPASGRPDVPRLGSDFRLAGALGLAMGSCPHGRLPNLIDSAHRPSSLP